MGATSIARRLLAGALALTVGVAIGALVSWRDERPAPGAPPSVAPAGRRLEAEAGGVGTIERRLRDLSAALAREASRRRDLEERIETLSAQLAALGAAPPAPEVDDIGEEASSAESGGASDAPAVAALAVADTAATAEERALIIAGVDPAVAQDIKKRRDQLVLDEIYLRDQAQREGWLESPEFEEQLAEIRGGRVSIRAEIGDDAYDAYLHALARPNRVAVHEVLQDSPAAQLGFQAGDVVLRYGDARLFRPGDLVSQTRGGRAGETVRVEILRDGVPMALDVPRGPLGVRIVGTRGTPGG